MRKMTLTAVAAMSLALGLLGARTALAEHAQQGKSANTVSNAISTTATVRAIDTQNRTVTLEGPEGKQFRVDVPPDADLKKLKTGDKVDVDYYQALAVGLEPPGTQMSGPTEQMVRQQTPSGAITTRQVTAVAEVVSVSPSEPTVTFRGPRGNVETVAVQDPEMQDKARKLKPGDKVQFKYTEATAYKIKATGKAHHH